MVLLLTPIRERRLRLILEIKPQGTIHEKGREMTRKDFQMIAGVLADVGSVFVNTGSDEADEVLAVIVDAFADALAGTNPAFDRARFLSACGVSA